MTEAEWLTCTDIPQIREALRGKASGRKLRLFDVACCRRVWGLLPDDEAAAPSRSPSSSRTAGPAANHSRKRSAEPARQRNGSSHRSAKRVRTATRPRNRSPFRAPRANEQLRTLQGYYLTGGACRANAEWHHTTFGLLGLARRLEESTATGGRPSAVAFAPFLELLRDIFGPLPSRPVAVAPDWLQWNHGTVPAVARHVYEDRAFHDLPILADALEDAGCTDSDILGHCRGAGPHVRGCWVVDLLLGHE